jgi:hypothetical protein
MSCSFELNLHVHDQLAGARSDRHRDLAGFLTAELETFLRQDVVSLGELLTGGEAAALTLLRARVIREIAILIIAFLAQNGLTCQLTTLTSAIVDRMSDHCGLCRYNPKERTGEHACPYSTLYWDFLDHNRDRLLGKHRMGSPTATSIGSTAWSSTRSAGVRPPCGVPRLTAGRL